MSKGPVSHSGSSSPLRIRQRRQGTRAFTPNRPLIVVKGDETHELPASAVSISSVGLKAYGLLCIPHQWVPPFYVISSDALTLKDERLLDFINACNARVFPEADRLVVRSSGTSETMEQRGRLLTQNCSPSEVLSTVRQLATELKKAGIETVHWIVQRYPSHV
jgi:hypothetical protein